ncbi:MAG: hypothetical protein ABIG84_08475 [archaeon]
MPARIIKSLPSKDNIYDIKPLKRSLSGLEIEVQTLNKNGFIVHGADTIIRECKKINKGIPIVKECSKSMVELGAYPSVKVQNTAMDLLNNFQMMIEVAEKNDLVIYPLSVYPGTFEAEMRKNKWYNIQSKIIFGSHEFKMAGKTPAFHYHYTLPRGVFDKKKRFLKPLIHSKVKKTLIDSYNLAIAMDPALITLFQSSPLLDGKYVAKDSRVLIQRTGRAFPFEGMYHKQPKLAGLPIYKETLSDLIYVIKKRHSLLKKLFVKNNLDPFLVSTYGKVLDFSWHAVRINKIGTLEQRTMDMNHPKYVIAGTVLLKYVFRRIQQDFLNVIPSDVGLEEPFKVEGNVLHIPPHTHIRKKLQYSSAYEGFENKEIRDYTRSFFRFAKKCTHRRYYKAIRPFSHMINRNKSVSDILLDKFKKKGYGREDRIPDNICANVALSSCKQLYNEIEKTKKTISDLD